MNRDAPSVHAKVQRFDGAEMFDDSSEHGSGSGVRRLRDLLQRFGENREGLIDLLPRDDQRRLEAHDVAAYAADSDEHSLAEAGVANRFGFGWGGGFPFVLSRIH